MLTIYKVFEFKFYNTHRLFALPVYPRTILYLPAIILKYIHPYPSIPSYEDPGDACDLGGKWQGDSRTPSGSLYDLMSTAQGMNRGQPRCRTHPPLQGSMVQSWQSLSMKTDVDGGGHPFFIRFVLLWCGFWFEKKSGFGDSFRRCVKWVRNAHRPADDFSIVPFCGYGSNKIRA